MEISSTSSIMSLLLAVEDVKCSLQNADIFVVTR